MTESLRGEGETWPVSLSRSRRMGVERWWFQQTEWPLRGWKRVELRECLSLQETAKWPERKGTASSWWMVMLAVKEAWLGNNIGEDLVVALTRLVTLTGSVTLT